MKIKRKWLNFEVIGSISAMSLSIVAVFIAWDQSIVMRAQQHASVWPIVGVEITLDRDKDENYLSFDLKNVGVGPAIVKSATMYVGGKSVMDYNTFAEGVLVTELTSRMSINASSFIDVLGAGETHNALKFSWERSPEFDAGFVKLAHKMIANDDLVSVEICYCSVFQHCWETKDNVAIASERVDECEVQSHDLAEAIVASANAQSMSEPVVRDTTADQELPPENNDRK